MQRLPGLHTPHRDAFLSALLCPQSLLQQLSNDSEITFIESEQKPGHPPNWRELQQADFCLALPLPGESARRLACHLPQPVPRTRALQFLEFHLEFLTWSTLPSHATIPSTPAFLNPTDTLRPVGGSRSSLRFYEAIAAGCIPVVFEAGTYSLSTCKWIWSFVEPFRTELVNG